MRRETSVGSQVYKVLFPYPTKKVDPSSWSEHVKSNLLPEIRVANMKFYGETDSLEARYAGLDYAYIPHRNRLKQFHHHRRLFQAFTELGLTEHEIYELCTWEGTLYKKHQYERDHGVKIEDTTSDLVPTPEEDAEAHAAGGAVLHQEEADAEDETQSKSDGEEGVEERNMTLTTNVQRTIGPHFRQRYPELWRRAREYAQETYRTEISRAVQQGERVDQYADTLAERVISEILSTRA